MQATGKFLLGLLGVFVFSGLVYAGNTAGVFRLPYDPNQHWSDACDRDNRIGYKTSADQVFMQLYPENNKYHPAEDWNGKCGFSTDLGGVLYAVADGVVENAEMGGSPTSRDNGGWLLIRHPLPDGNARYILYEHIANVETNPRTSAKFKTGDPVYIGDTIARLGDGNGAYPNAAHLHFEMRRDNSLKIDQTPYYNPLKISDALKYSSPSLFIDDRRYPSVLSLSRSTSDWNYFAWYLNAPSSTAFIEYNGERYSLLRAVQANLIWRSIWEWNGAQWTEYADITSVFFRPLMYYAIWPFVEGAKLTILTPGGNFPDDRAKIDMLHRAASDARFTDIKTETYNWDLSWNPAWELRWVKFGFNGGILDVYHATSTTNPMVRFVGFHDPATGAWNGWTQVNSNTLD
ncbi:MAG: M23 family metallopeptidase [Patescibacteria group bacterium]